LKHLLNSRGILKNCRTSICRILLHKAALVPVSATASGRSFSNSVSTPVRTLAVSSTSGDIRGQQRSGSIRFFAGHVCPVVQHARHFLEVYKFGSFDKHGVRQGQVHRVSLLPILFGTGGPSATSASASSADTALCNRAPFEKRSSPLDHCAPGPVSQSSQSLLIWRPKHVSKPGSGLRSKNVKAPTRDACQCTGKLSGALPKPTRQLAPMRHC